MRKVILSVAVSCDGLIEGPGGEYDWCFTDQDYGMTEFLNRVDAVFYGRKSFELTRSMELPPEMETFSFPKMKEYVFSNTLNELPEGVTLIGGDINRQVREIKGLPGKDIWLFGGSSLTTSLMNLGLVDEIQLAVHPLILGPGKRLFSDIRKRIPLTLIEAKTYSSGLVSLTYQVQHLSTPPSG